MTMAFLVDNYGAYGLRQQKAHGNSLVIGLCVFTSGHAEHLNQVFLLQQSDPLPFISQDDMVRRKVSKSTVETLKQAGCLNDLPETSQVTLFEFGG